MVGGGLVALKGLGVLDAVGFCGVGMKGRKVGVLCS